MLDKRVIQAEVLKGDSGAIVSSPLTGEVVHNVLVLHNDMSTSGNL